MLQRPVGISSRLSPGPGPRHPWDCGNGCVLELPVVLDLVATAPSGTTDYRVDAVVDLGEHGPVVTSVTVRASHGLDLRALQAEFRWATPLEVVTITVPALLARGIDPFQHDFAVRGYPDAAHLGRAPHRELTDEFLVEVVRLYLDLGHGAHRRIAELYRVSPRTAVSWIEKARRRGLLTPTTPGARGGALVVPGEEHGTTG